MIDVEVKRKAFNYMSFAVISNFDHIDALK